MLSSEQADMERYLQSLQFIARAVNSDSDLNTILGTVVATVCEHSPWPMACIARVDGEKQEVSFVAEHGFVRAGLGYTMSWPVAASLTPVVTQSGQPLIIEDALALADYPAVRESARIRGYRSVIMVPMRLENERAAMWFCSPRVRSFARADITFACAIADQAAIAINHARLLRREKDSADKLLKATVVAAAKNRELQSLLATHTSLANLVLEDRGLGGIADAVAALLNNPVIIEDRLSRPLLQRWGPDEPAVPPDRPLFSAKARNQMLALLQGQRSLIINEVPGLAIPWRMLVAPIVAGKETLGYVHVLEARRKFEEVDSVIAEQAATVLALELIKQQTRSRIERELKTDLLRDLLSGQYASVDEVRHRAALTGVDLAQPTSLMLVSPGSAIGGHVFADLLECLSQYVARNCPGGVVTLQGPCVLVLVPDSCGPAKVAEQILSRLQQALPQVPISIGIGSLCTEVTSYARSYREARKALGVLRFRGSRSGSLAYCDLGVYGILFREQEMGELTEFTARMIGALVRYDCEHDMQLVNTVEAFLCNNSHLQRTAKELFIHVTTLRYRLRRISEIITADLNEAETRLNLQLALKIHRWNGSGAPAAHA